MLLTKSLLFLCHHKGFHVIIYLDDVLVVTHSKHAGMRAWTVLCSLVVHLGLHINFSEPELNLTQ